MDMARYDGELIGNQNYRLLRFLKDEGAGEIYLAEDIAKENIVTIRLVYPKEGLFLRKAELLSKFKHRNILPILGYRIVDARSPKLYRFGYVVTEYRPNSSFRDRYPQGTTLSLDAILPFVRQIASAVQYLHDNSFFNEFQELRGYVINPDNLLISRDFEVLLTGFEDILFFDWDEDHRADDPKLLSQVSYLAPEQFTGKYTIASIQYSLACTIYEWLCGSMPFQSNDLNTILYQHTKETPPSLYEKNHAVPQAISNVVMKALAKKPEDRYESIMAFADAFEQATMGKRANSIGEQFGKYLAVHLFEGYSNVGQTYLGLGMPEPNVFKGLVAIKVLFGLHSREFSEKAQRLQQLQHSNILRILDYGTKYSSPYLITDYARGGNLLDRHPRGNILPPKTILSYVKQVAAALQYAHNARITHRFVWPKNILVGKNDEIILGGFEYHFVDWEEERRITEEDLYMATYGSPEFRQGKATFASDQYSLAVIVYEWLCGDLPFRSKSDGTVKVLHINASPLSLREQNSSIPHEVETVVMKALSKDPEKRYETIQDFADALEEAINSDTDKTGKYKMPDRSGEQFGKYRLVRLLGSGGFAEVYLGQHIKLNTFAAIKVLHTRLSAKELEAFEKEAQIIANLRHPSIVRVLGFDDEGGVPFLVMDHAAEGTMRQFHARGSRLSLPLVVKYIKQIADALQYAHNQKIIHRDVKPANMLIMSSDTIMLSDFGLAVIAHSERSWRVQDKAGTALYMAPEQFRGKAVPASDQYSLAVTAYEWLCGAPPFDEGDEIQLGYQHAHEPVPPMDKRGAVVSKDVEQVIMKALEKDPTKRFSSVKEFAEALEKAAAAG
jgi:serine/threonine protein kinase